MGNGNGLHAKAQQHLAAWRASGLTQVGYCATQGLKATTFNTWLRRDVLAQSAGQPALQEPEPTPTQAQSKLLSQAKPALTLIPARPASSVQVALAPAPTPEQPSRDHWQLQHPSGWCLTLPAGVAPATVAALLRALA